MYLAANRVDPRYGRVVQDENGVKSYYNALAVQVNKRFSYGFQALLSYTWSHAIDDGQGAAADSLYYSSPTLTTYNGNYAFDKGSSALDQRHRAVLSLVEQPTFTHRDGAFYKYVVNNWQFATITTLASGRPETAQIRTTDTAVPGMAYTTSIDGFGGNYRVPFWPVNSLYTPAAYRADASVSQFRSVQHQQHRRGYEHQQSGISRGETCAHVDSRSIRCGDCVGRFSGRDKRSPRPGKCAPGFLTQMLSPTGGPVQD